MKSYVQWALILWLSVLGLLTLGSSIALLVCHANIALPPPPNPPEVLQPNNVNSNSLTSYTQQVTAYRQSVTAYKAYTEALQKSNATAVYTLVIKDTLSPFFLQLTVGLLGYAFAKAGATAITNRSLVKQNATPQSVAPIKLFD